MMGCIMTANDPKNNYINLIIELNRVAITSIILALQSKIIYCLVKQYLMNKISIHLFLWSILLVITFAAFLTYKISIYEATEEMNYKRFIGWLLMVTISAGLTIYNTKGDVMFLMYAVGAVTLIIIMMYGLLTKKINLSKNYLIAMAAIGCFTSLAIGTYLEYTYNHIQSSIIVSVITAWRLPSDYKRFNTSNAKTF